MDIFDKFDQSKQPSNYSQDKLETDSFGSSGFQFHDFNSFGSNDYLFEISQDINSSVAICVSVLSDAIVQLPADIIRVQTSKGSRTEIDDNAHPANFMFKGLNGDMTWADFMQGIVTSLLLDGNVYIQIISKTELYLLDPSKIKINQSQDQSKIISYTYLNNNYSTTIPRDQMIHMRNYDVHNPLKGKSMLESIRKELRMDYFVKVFNENFFKNGGVVGWMWNPEHELTIEQHKMLRKAMANEIQGVGNAFKVFINRFAGKLETPDQKHKDIAFLELLKHIRETIFGLFKVPPYKGGILEYANYANSTQQQESFWTDGVKPLVRRIVDIINKDFIWKYFDLNHELKFDYSNIAALQGDPKQRMEVLTGYKKEGILTTDECRIELGYEPLNSEESQASATQDQYVQIYDTFFQEQSKRIEDKLLKSISGLDTLIRFCTTDELFNIEEEDKLFKARLEPFIRDTFNQAGEVAFNAVNVSTIFDMKTDDVKLHLDTLNYKHEIINRKTYNIVDQLLSRAKQENWTKEELINRVKDNLSWKYAEQCAKEIVPAIVRRSMEVVDKQKLYDDATEVNNANS
jgi:HK97 family phage portal protein